MPLHLVAAAFRCLACSKCIYPQRSKYTLEPRVNKKYLLFDYLDPQVRIYLDLQSARNSDPYTPLALGYRQIFWLFWRSRYRYVQKTYVYITICQSVMSVKWEQAVDRICTALLERVLVRLYKIDHQDGQAHVTSLTECSKHNETRKHEKQRIDR